MVVRWTDTFRSKRHAAQQIVIDGEPMDGRHLCLWIREPDRRFDPKTAQVVALVVDIPLEAVLFKHVPIRDLPCEKARRERAA